MVIADPAPDGHPDIQGASSPVHRNTGVSQSLYRKWRSQTFDEMVGQQAIVATLRNALKSHSLRHAYLFAGPRGTGKTTAARLLAKTVNCAHPTESEPCNVCEQCREITAGISFNVIEIDAASHRGIDHIRDLRERVLVPPVTGKYKVYILDEAHMLTTEACNALLKTLEEPPVYALFVLATTDIHKLLPTVLSRCQRFDFRRLTVRQIATHLDAIAQEEQVEIEHGALELLARTASGSMRDALSLLDQAIAYAGAIISLAQLREMLGIADPQIIWKLVACIAGGESGTLLTLIHTLSEAGADFQQIYTQVIEDLRALLLAKAGGDVATIMDLTETEAQEVSHLVPAFRLEELLKYVRIFIQEEIHKSKGTPQLGLEVAALECLDLHAQMPVPTIEPSGFSPLPFPFSASQSPLESQVGLVSAIPSQPERLSPFISEEDNPPSPQEDILTAASVVAGWEQVKQRIRQRNGLLVAYLQQSRIMGLEGAPDSPRVLIQVANQRHFDAIRSNERLKDIEWALSTEFKQPCTVHLILAGQPAGQGPGKDKRTHTVQRS